MKPKAQFGPLIRTDIGPGPFTDISVKDQVWDHMVHRYDVDHKAPISEVGRLIPISVQKIIQKIKWTGERSPWFQNKLVLRGNGPCSEPSDIGSSSGSFIRFLRAVPFPFHTAIGPISNQ